MFAASVSRSVCVTPYGIVDLSPDEIAAAGLRLTKGGQLLPRSRAVILETFIECMCADHWMRGGDCADL